MNKTKVLKIIKAKLTQLKSINFPALTIERSMSGYISCLIFIGIILFIIFLFWRRRKIENELDIFYKTSQLYGVREVPETIRSAVGDGKVFNFKGSLVIEHKPYEFYWLEKLTSSMTVVNNSAQTTVSYILAIAFPPNVVSQEFINKAFELKETAAGVTDFVVLNTDKPFRVEKLADGSFLMMWHVLNRADVYQKKLDWLEANLS
jgi:hypothetical protein